MSKIAFRGGFSDRNGIKPLNTEIQIRDFDQITRSDLFNSVSKFYEELNEDKYDKSNFLFKLIRDAFHEPVGYGGYLFDPDKVFKQYVGETILHGDYDDVLSLLEFFCISFNRVRMLYITDINNIFKTNYVGYRFIDSRICPITSEEEIVEIEKACSDRTVSTHIEKAKEYLSNRKKPDYENSIKESITAVEVVCNMITGNSKSSLGDALKLIKKKGISIHPSLESAFEKIYGYTSDAKGIRHAGDLGGPDSTFEEARYMLVSCSAFINYAKTCASKS